MSLRWRRRGKRIDAFKRGEGRDAAIALRDADLQAPVPRPGRGNFSWVAANYLRHLDELRKEGAGRGEKIITPPMPHIFAKYHNSITGPGKPVIYPKIVRQLRHRRRTDRCHRQARLSRRGGRRARLRRRLHDHQ